MQIVKFTESINFAYQKSAGGAGITFEAMRDYVVTSAQLDRFLKEENVRNRIYKVSRLECRMAPFHASLRKPGSNRVLLYNGSGGYGDQIMTWPIARWLASQKFDVHIMTEPGNQACWYGFNWLKTINLVPMPLEQFKMYDHHVMMEHVVNLDEHPDQLHPVDAMFMRIGVDPQTVDPALKTVAPVFTHLEHESTRKYDHRQKLGFYQLSSANGTRALSPGDSAFLASKLAEAFPDTHWLCIYDQYIPKEYVEALYCRTCKGTGKTVDDAATCPECQGSRALAHNLEPAVFANLRELWALVGRRASVCVGPDSMMVHVCGTMNVPCVGLWGLTDPQRRVAYYKNHKALWPRQVCPHAPCFGYAATLPAFCPQHARQRTVCEVMSAITPDQVVSAVNEVRRTA